ncbi:MAG: hypothetical protein ACYTF6_02660 [Planctomycetota bacterium]|jgi:hypothetical protein
MKGLAISAGLVVVIVAGGPAAQTAAGDEEEEKFAVTHEYLKDDRLLLVSGIDATTIPKGGKEKVRQFITMHLLLEISAGETPEARKVDCEVKRLVVVMDTPMGKVEADTDADDTREYASDFEKQYAQSLANGYKGMCLTFSMGDGELRALSGSGGLIDMMEQLARLNEERRKQMLAAFGVPFAAAIELPSAYSSPEQVAVGESWDVSFTTAPLPLTSGTVNRYKEEMQCTLEKVEDTEEGRVATVRLKGKAEIPGGLPGQRLGLEKTGTALFNIDKRRLLEITAESSVDDATQGEVHIVYELKLSDAPAAETQPAEAPDETEGAGEAK